MNPILGRYPQGIPFSSPNPAVRFYGIIIVLGAILCLIVSNLRAHKDGYDYHFFDSIFFVAFPSGIIGARIWYVIASYQQEFAGKSFLDMIAIWDGGYGFCCTDYFDRTSGWKMGKLFQSRSLRT